MWRKCNSVSETGTTDKERQYERRLLLIFTAKAGVSEL